MRHTFELTLRRSPLDPWLGVVVRVGAVSGLGLGLALTGVALTIAAFAFDVTGLVLLGAMGLCTMSVPMMVLPLFALVFLQLGGRRLRVVAGEVALLRTDGPELSRASVESVRASVKKGVYEAWGRRGRVLHLGVGAKPVAIGAVEPERAAEARAAGWPVAAPPELECTSEELERLLRALELT
ncbi:MAG: hypothetical protein K1X94_22430 [Sandaracinaceae bacterium]|nr:hypothetical protein [Sandaracinaceae bacterium]